MEHSKIYHPGYPNTDASDCDTCTVGTQEAAEIIGVTRVMIGKYDRAGRLTNVAKDGKARYSREAVANFERKPRGRRAGQNIKWRKNR